MNWIQFSDRDSLDQALCDRVAKKLRQSISAQGLARILFSGGSTPLGLWQRLSTLSLPWERIHIGLVDDRMVPEASPHSNAGQLRAHLIANLPERQPVFYPLVRYPENESANMAAIEPHIVEMGTPDLVLLGMGTDGHFASMFPGDTASSEGLKAGPEAQLLYTRAPAPPERRITYTWPFLSHAGEIILHITGEAKRCLVQGHGSRHKTLPIDFVLAGKECPVDIFWAP